MRYEGLVRSYNGVATDLSSEANSLYRFCKLSSGTAAINDTSGGECIGVLINKPIAGEAAAIQYSGVATVRAGAAITAGVKVMSNNAGKVVTATTTLVAQGIALTAATNDGDMIEVLLGLNGYKV